MKNRLPIKMALPEAFLEEEVRCGYTVSAEMKAVWAVELDLYGELERVCAKHGLTLFADGGTVLGAVRHGGFIPWDDDMDLGMSRADYERLCRVAPSEFKAPYFWQTEETDPGTSRGHGQLRNSATTALPSDGMTYGKNQGIFIDVFVYDNVPDDDDERRAFLREVRELDEKKLKYRDYYCMYNRSTGIKRVLKKVYLSLFRRFHGKYRNGFHEAMEAAKLRYENRETSLWCNLYAFYPHNLEKLVLKKEIYSRFIDMPFETLTVRVPADYDAYLTHVYGNWREYVIGGSVHGSMIFDPYTPFAEYMGRRDGARRRQQNNEEGSSHD